jgi:hypothetical protein
VTLLPRHRYTRFAATAWLLVSVVLLVATLLRPDVYAGERTALSWLTPLYWLSFPLGHLGVLAGIELRLQLYLHYSMVPSILAQGVFLWSALTVLGYCQWFVLLPWVARACRQLSRFLFNRDAAR